MVNLLYELRDRLMNAKSKSDEIKYYNLICSVASNNAVVSVTSRCEFRTTYLVNTTTNIQELIEVKK